MKPIVRLVLEISLEDADYQALDEAALVKLTLESKDAIDGLDELLADRLDDVLDYDHPTLTVTVKE